MQTNSKLSDVGSCGLYKLRSCLTVKKSKFINSCKFSVDCEALSPLVHFCCCHRKVVNILWNYHALLFVQDLAKVKKAWTFCLPNTPSTFHSLTKQLLNMAFFGSKKCLHIQIGHTVFVLCPFWKMCFITLARKCGTNLEWGIAFIFVTRSNKNASHAVWWHMFMVKK